MENLSFLMELFNHLNRSNSKTFIEHFDVETGVIKLSDHLVLNAKQLMSREGIINFVDCSMEFKNLTTPSEL
jgi:hypothetical protein